MPKKNICLILAQWNQSIFEIPFQFILVCTPIISGHKKSLLKYKKWQKSMAHFVMQNLERSFAELENQTYKETCVFPQFKQEKHSSNWIISLWRALTEQTVSSLWCSNSSSSSLNPNWHEAGRIYPPYNFFIGFCQLNFYQKFPNIFGGHWVL